MSDPNHSPEALGEYLTGLLQRLDRYGLPNPEYVAFVAQGEQLIRRLPAMRTDSAVLACTAYLHEVFAAITAAHKALWRSPGSA